MSKDDEHVGIVHVIERIEQFALMGDDWNKGQGAKATTPESCETAVTLVKLTAFPPHVAPTACGGIQIKWADENGNALELWVSTTGECHGLTRAQEDSR